MTKAFAAGFALVLILSAFIITGCPVKAATEVQTTAHIELSPSVLNYGEIVCVIMTVTPPPPPSAGQLNGFKVRIVRPDGALENNTIYSFGKHTFPYFGPYSSYSNGSNFFTFLPFMTGTYKFQLEYPGETFEDGTVYYMPSTSEVAELTVRGEPLPSSSPPSSNISTIETCASLSITPNPVALNNIVNVTLQVQPPPPTSADYFSMQVNITNPNGYVEVKNNMDSDSNGSTWFSYTPTLKGSYVFVLSYEGKNFTTETTEICYLPSTSLPITLTVTEYGDAPSPTATPIPYPIPSQTPSQTPTPKPQPTLPIPTLQLSCASSTMYLHFQVQITGNLTINGDSLPNYPVQLSYSSQGNHSWTNLTLVYTDENGEFKATWAPLATGYYLVKATWEGNSNYSAATKTVNFAVTPSEQQNVSYVFSVMSNSTLSSFSFDSVSQKLSFTVSGPSETTGYVEVYVPNSLIKDVSNLKVTVDGEQVAFTLEAQGDSLRLFFTYHHSTHQVAIGLGSEQANFPSQNEQWPIYVAVIAAVVVVVSVVLALRKRKQATG